MAKASDAAGDAANQQTQALKLTADALVHLRKEMHAAAERWTDERKRELDGQRERMIFELERNQEVLERERPEIYRLHNSAWKALQATPLFNPDTQRRIDWLYTSALAHLNDQFRASASEKTFVEVLQDATVERPVLDEAQKVLRQILGGGALRARYGLERQWSPAPGSSFRADLPE